MLVLSNAINVFFDVVYVFIMIRILLSWIPVVRDTAFGNLMYALTEPILGPIRSMLERSPLGGGMMLDISPIIALFVMNIVRMLLQSLVLML